MFSYGLVVQMPDLPELDESTYKMLGNAMGKAIDMMWQVIQKENLKGPYKVYTAVSGADEMQDSDESVPARVMLRLDAPEKGGIIIVQ